MLCAACSLFHMILLVPAAQYIDSRGFALKSVEQAMNSVRVRAVLVILGLCVLELVCSVSTRPTSLELSHWVDSLGKLTSNTIKSSSQTRSFSLEKSVCIWWSTGVTVCLEFGCCTSGVEYCLPLCLRPGLFVVWGSILS